MEAKGGGKSGKRRREQCIEGRKGKGRSDSLSKSQGVQNVAELEMSWQIFVTSMAPQDSSGRTWEGHEHRRDHHTVGVQELADLGAKYTSSRN